MAKMSGYELGVRNFTYHLALDAIDAFLADHRDTARYIEALTNEVESTFGLEDDEEVTPELIDLRDGILDQATGAANELANTIKRATGDDFTGPRYTSLLAAVYTKMGIEY